MNYIVLDLEWNQAPSKDQEVKSIPVEIIEIGAIKLNDKQEILEQFSEIVKPEVYKELDENIKKIVNLTDEDIQKGKPFPEVFDRFWKWCGDDPIFCTWGPMDLIELQRNMRHYDFPSIARRPFFYYDVQKIFALFFDAEKQTRTLSFASDFFHLKEEGKFHSALTDAKYTARIFQKFDLRKAKKYMEIDYFTPPKTTEDEVYVSFASYAKFISQEYKSKDALLKAKRVKTTYCCICQAPASHKIDWFSNNSKNYFGLFYCKKHGYLKGKLRVKKSDNNHFFAVKTIKIVSKEDALRLKKQKEDIHIKKVEKLKKNV